MKTVSLFTGAGGMDLGLEAAGFHTAVAVERDGDSVKTLLSNRNWNVLRADVHDDAASPTALMARAELQPGDATLLCGGPPCQPFSKSGYWRTGDAKRLNDPRARTLDAYFEVLEGVLPEAFILENVPGLAYSDKDEGLTFVRRRVDEINVAKGVNYVISARQLNAAEYGVPQMRRRVFVVGHRGGRAFEFPAPRYSLPPPRKMGRSQGRSNQQSLPTLPQALTAWDALGHLEPDGRHSLALTGKHHDLLASVPEGCNYLYFTERWGYPEVPRLFGWRTRYWSMLLKLARNRPAWTLTASPGPSIGPFHWDSRRLAANELAALQTFPSNYRVEGTLRSAQRQLGNAVPSALAEVLGREIRRQLLDQAVSLNPTLLPERRDRIPEPTPPTPVPTRWWAEDAPRDAHKGKGKGPGARRRQTQ